MKSVRSRKEQKMDSIRHYDELQKQISSEKAKEHFARPAHSLKKETDNRLVHQKDILMCYECPLCKPKDTLRDGARWGICGMGGNIVYLEPHKEKRIKGSGYIHYKESTCGLYSNREEVHEKNKWLKRK